MKPSFDNEQENKFVDLLPHLIEALEEALSFHSLGESF